eukprot:m.106152 g.106152  ORF g.106152 m.106152 type:complete len:845 (-) comp9147_c4_seq4:243-2777(-)
MSSTPPPQQSSNNLDYMSEVWSRCGTIQIGLRSDYNGFTTFSCLSCSKKFNSHSKLERHSRVHTRIKPFQCCLCKTRFTQKSSLKTHFTRHSQHDILAMVRSKSADDILKLPASEQEAQFKIIVDQLLADASLPPLGSTYAYAAARTKTVPTLQKSLQHDDSDQTTSSSSLVAPDGNMCAPYGITQTNPPLTPLTTQDTAVQAFHAHHQQPFQGPMTPFLRMQLQRYQLHLQSQPQQNIQPNLLSPQSLQHMCMLGAPQPNMSFFPYPNQTTMQLDHAWPMATQFQQHIQLQDQIKQPSQKDYRRASLSKHANSNAMMSDDDNEGGESKKKKGFKKQSTQIKQRNGNQHSDDELPHQKIKEEHTSNERSSSNGSNTITAVDGQDGKATKYNSMLDNDVVATEQSVIPNQNPNPIVNMSKGVTQHVEEKEEGELNTATDMVADVVAGVGLGGKERGGGKKDSEQEKKAEELKREALSQLLIIQKPRHHENGKRASPSPEAQEENRIGQTSVLTAKRPKPSATNNNNDDNNHNHANRNENSSINCNNGDASPGHTIETRNEQSDAKHPHNSGTDEENEIAPRLSNGKSSCTGIPLEEEHHSKGNNQNDERESGCGSGSDFTRKEYTHQSIRSKISHNQTHEARKERNETEKNVKEIKKGEEKAHCQTLLERNSKHPKSTTQNQKKVAATSNKNNPSWKEEAEDVGGDDKSLFSSLMEYRHSRRVTASKALQQQQQQQYLSALNHGGMPFPMQPSLYNMSSSRMNVTALPAYPSYSSMPSLGMPFMYGFPPPYHASMGQPPMVPSSSPSRQLSYQQHYTPPNHSSQSSFIPPLFYQPFGSGQQFNHG